MAVAAASIGSDPMHGSWREWRGARMHLRAREVGLRTASASAVLRYCGQPTVPVLCLPACLPAVITHPRI